MGMGEARRRRTGIATASGEDRQAEGHLTQVVLDPLTQNQTRQFMAVTTVAPGSGLAALCCSGSLSARRTCGGLVEPRGYP